LKQDLSRRFHLLIIDAAGISEIEPGEVVFLKIALPDEEIDINEQRVACKGAKRGVGRIMSLPADRPQRENLPYLLPAVAQESTKS
jgi:tRNA/tmRNA/rRNA uracil-C5-methylase (TrmA/RlmC/RlmD family)